MKKFKKLYTLAALLVAGAAITACTSDDFADEGLAPQQGKTYTLSVNATKGADTRTLIDEGTTLSATWNTTDVVLVYKGENKVGELTPDAATATAKLTGEVTDVDVDDNLILKIGTPDKYATQKGTLEDIDANCNYSEATVTVTEIVGNAVNTSNATFENKQAIVKIALKDKFGGSTAKTAAQAAVGDAVYPDGTFYTVDDASSTALSVSKLIIKNAETNAVITTVTPNSAASELYVALAPCSAFSLKFEATANDLTYRAYENVTVEAGKFYQPTLNLSAAEAVVVYKSTDLSKDILAYALEDACDPSPWNPDNINTWVANHPVTGGTWRLPSTEDFKYMFEGCGGTPYAAATNADVSYNYGSLQTLITAAGGKKVIEEGDNGYWSSTENKGSNAYAFFFYKIDGNPEGMFWAMYKPNYWYYYRACLAFSNAIDYTDLSAEETANCYIVPVKGYYKFKATVKGNGSADLVGISKDTDASSIDKAELVWATFNTTKAPVENELIQNIYYKDGYVYFSTGDTYKEGNALVAIKDASNNILWSWHLWFESDDLAAMAQTYPNSKYVMMDRNLGALTNCYNADDALDFGFAYQNGRKDPFMMTASRTTFVALGVLGTYTSYGGGNVASSILNPTTVFGYDSWGGSPDNWKGSDKTIFDPSPPGWRVAPSNVWSASGFNSYTLVPKDNDWNTYHGWIFNNEAWFPATGDRWGPDHNNTGVVLRVWAQGDGMSLAAQNGVFGSTGDGSNPGHGYSVRPIKME